MPAPISTASREAVAAARHSRSARTSARRRSPSRSLLREASETPGRIAALVTPDRGLARARRGRAEALGDRRSTIRPAGRSRRTPPGILARLVAEAALGGCERKRCWRSSSIRSRASGWPPIAMRAGRARNLERAVLRGPRLRPGLAALRHALTCGSPSVPAGRRTAASAAEAARRSRRRRSWEPRASSPAYRGGACAARSVWREDGLVSLSALVEAHLAALLRRRGRRQAAPALFADEAGEALAVDLRRASRQRSRRPGHRCRATIPASSPRCCERAAVRRRGGLDPRIHIWGTLEARLQSVDMVVLGGLNEGTWPGQTRLDPLPVAADARGAGARSAGAAHRPRRARFRAGARAPGSVADARQPAGRRAARRLALAAAAHRLRRRPELAGGDARARRRRFSPGREPRRTPRQRPPKRPRPSPPVELRPTQLSRRREIETLIRDPYAIYARARPEAPAVRAARRSSRRGRARHARPRHP